MHSTLLDTQASVRPYDGKFVRKIDLTVGEFLKRKTALDRIVIGLIDQHHRRAGTYVRAVNKVSENFTTLLSHFGEDDIVDIAAWQYALGLRGYASRHGLCDTGFQAGLEMLFGPDGPDEARVAATVRVIKASRGDGHNPNGWTLNDCC